jgi:hypothetical protein
MKIISTWFIKTLTVFVLAFAGIELMVQTNAVLSNEQLWVRGMISLVIIVVTLYWEVYILLVDGEKILPNGSKIKTK